MLEMNMKEEEKMKLLIDSNSAIDLAKHTMGHGRSKYIPFP